MHVLILSSLNPDFNHSVRAAHKILACLLENMARIGYQVSYAVAQFPEVRQLKKETDVALSALGIRYLGDFSNALLSPKWHNRILTPLANLRRAFLPSFNDDQPQFKNPKKVASLLMENRADVVLLFWDTIFEYLVPYFHIPVVGYGARPRFAAYMARINSDSENKKFSQRLKTNIVSKILKQQEKRHISRARKLAKLSNICALDTAYYNQRGVSCVYIPNTWPDAFGPSWYEKRNDLFKSQSGLEILGNIGGLYATGNYFGLNFLAKEVLPLLTQKLANIDWQINICGPGSLPEDLADKLRHPRVAIKGYVPDLDSEMLTNHIFLLLNNAGPFTGGYTRVIYAFSSGACLIAHRKLAESMPEVQHGVNALLGNTPEEITQLVLTAAGDLPLRKRLGLAARETYMRFYQPSVVVHKLTNLMAEAL